MARDEASKGVYSLGEFLPVIQNDRFGHGHEVILRTDGKEHRALRK
jgi:hypothetical protein